jgi:Na+/H+ antiporter NhaA
VTHWESNSKQSVPAFAQDRSSSQSDPLGIFGRNIRQFLHLESATGLILLAAAVLAMIVKNSPMSDLYVALLNVVGEVRIGDLSVEKPLFLWVNAGIAFEGMKLGVIVEPVPLGIMAGLFIGKQLGIYAAIWAMVRLKLASLPTGASWLHMYGVALLCGIGFTMSMFIGSLAFAEGTVGYARADRLAIIIGSLLSGVCGYLILVYAGRHKVL